MAVLVEGSVAGMRFARGAPREERICVLMVVVVVVVMVSGEEALRVPALEDLLGSICVCFAAEALNDVAELDCREERVAWDEVGTDAERRLGSRARDG
jgi:hypothetical protein